MKALKSKSEYSGKFVLRMMPEMHQKLHALARERNLSLNKLCLELMGVAPKPQRLEQKSFANSEALLSAIRSEFGDNLLGVVWFGSSFLGKENSNSDIDLLLVLNIPPNRGLYKRWEKMVESKNISKLFLLPLSPQFVEFPKAGATPTGSLWLETAVESQTLWEKDDSIHHIYVQIRDLIASGKFVRLKSHGHSYWRMNS